MIIYLFSQDIPIYLARRIYSSVSQRSYVSWYAKLRLLLINDRRIPPGNFLSDYVDTSMQEIQIDESCFGKKQKHHRGSVHNRTWVFGMMERRTRRTIFRVVSQRNRDTLLPIIKENVALGSIITSDAWKAYDTLESEGYKHEVVVHKDGFISNSGAHTNGIEGNTL